MIVEKLPDIAKISQIHYHKLRRWTSLIMGHGAAKVTQNVTKMISVPEVVESLTGINLIDLISLTKPPTNENQIEEIIQLKGANIAPYDLMSMKIWNDIYRNCLIIV